MSIEVRNFTPSNQATSVSINGNINFDIVDLDSYTSDITSLTVDIDTSSNIDDDTHTVSYEYTDTEITVTNVSSTHYHVKVNPSTPYDEGLEVTVKVNIEGIDELSTFYMMEEFSSIFYTTYSGLISDFKYAFIHWAQEIPVGFESLRKDSTSSPLVFDSAFSTWNRLPAPKVRVNSVIFPSDHATYGHSIDFEEGTVTFSDALAYNDIVEVSYVFAFFSDEQIEAFFRQAVAVWNLNPPSGGPINIHSASGDVQSAMLIGAATFAFRTLMFSLSFQETRIVFDNASWGDGWLQSKDLINSLHESYSSDFKDLLAAKKVKLPSIKNVVTPSYTMPGGRSRMFRYLFK